MQGYVRADISSKDDLKIREDLDLADAQLEEVRLCLSLIYLMSLSFAKIVYKYAKQSHLVVML